MNFTYQREGVTLYCGDCLDILPELEPGSVDAVVTDPPYFLPAMHYQTRKVFARSLGDLSILEHYFRSIFVLLDVVLSGTGVWYIFCDGQSYPVFYVQVYPYARRVVPLVWDKMTSINGYSWRHQHELILFAEKPGSPSVPTGDGDILRFPAVRVESRLHPAEKPIPLLERLITKSVAEDGVVLDSFGGSASTGVACIQTGRRFIGIEIERKYFDIAVERIEAALDCLPVAQRRAGQRGLFEPA